MNVFFCASVSVLATLALSAPAFANCEQNCMARYGCEAEYGSGTYTAGGQCEGHHSDCVLECQNVPAYGAIAYDKSNGAWGMSYAPADEATAKSTALNSCGQRGPNCEIVAEAHDECAATATGNGQVLGWGLGASVEAAEEAAKNDCLQKLGDNCAIQLSRCFSP